MTEINPGVSVDARGPRLQLQANYAYQQRYYANDSQGNSNNHALTSNGLLDVWNRNLFVQASALIAQQNVSPFGAQAVDNVNLTGNRNEVRRLSISPYWISRLGNWANIQARYTWNQAESTGTTSATDSESKSINLSLSSGPVFNDLGWTLSHSYQEIESSTGEFTTRDLQTTTLNLRYRVLPTVTVLGSVGREDNSYGSVRGTDVSSTWSAGFDWAPSPRTRVAATVGEREFGKTYTLDASHRTRLTTWTVGYNEQIVANPGVFTVDSTTSTAFTLDQLFLTQIPDPVARRQFVEALITSTGLPTNLTTSVDFLTNQVSLSKRLHGAFGLRGVRSNLVVSVFRDDRTRDTAGATVTGTDPFTNSDRVIQTGYSAALSWRFSERTSGNALFGQTRAEATDTGRQDDNSRFSLGVSHRFQPKVHGAVNYRLSDRDSNVPGQHATEHAVIGTLMMTF